MTPSPRAARVGDGMKASRVAVPLGLLVLAVLLTGSVPASGSPTAGGTWSYTRGDVTCRFGGLHETIAPDSYGRTSDANGYCGHLRVLFKWKDRRTGVVYESGWRQTSQATQASVTVYVLDSIAVATRHQAQNNFDLSWSPIQQPHAY